ncbi:MAG: adenosine deaminase [Ignavibacteriae bacterium]|nr:MAG: adenosine deaminase [Ignavibacteriota bacterium]
MINKLKTLEKLPKVELHLHLDCSLSFDVVSKIRPDISLKKYQSEFVGPPKCKNLSEILSYVTNQLNLMQTEENLRLVVKDLFDQLQRENVVYAEIRFAPLLHLTNELKPEEVVEIVADETTNCVNHTGIKAGILLCTLRHFSEKESLQTVKLVKRFIANSPVAGFDIAADEGGYTIEANKEAFLYAIKHDLPRTAHAGEAKGPESIWETIDNFKPSRIGHGVRSIEDKNLIEYLIKNDIHLEICPTCNIQTNIFNEYKNHPINFLYNSGVSLSVNTDGRTLANVSLSEEYKNLINTFNWGAEHFVKCNLNAISKAFIPEQEKKHLRQKIISGYPA